MRIIHSKIMDGFGELARHKFYKSFRSHCGICDREIQVTPSVQKWLLEKKGLPVKMLRRGAVFCEACTRRRARIKYLRKNDNGKGIENGDGVQELEELSWQEACLEAESESLYENAHWPY